MNFNKVSFQSKHHYHFLTFSFPRKRCSLLIRVSTVFLSCSVFTYEWICVLYFYYTVTRRALNDCVTVSRTWAPFGVSIYNSSCSFNEEFSSFNHFSLTITTAKGTHMRTYDMFTSRVYWLCFGKETFLCCGVNRKISRA